MKVLVGMSGGIDSSVAALLLKESGFTVEGVTMTVWKNDGRYPSASGGNACFSPDKSKDIDKISKICEKLGINNIVLDISDLYESVVMNNFRNEYLSGRTPNPCIWCNQKIKFGAMLSFAKQKGITFDKFATGHYARIARTNDGRWAIKRAADEKKDQSYFLYRLSQSQIASTLFPLGDLTKQEVRKIDIENGFHDSIQTESQDFYNGKYTDLLNIKPEKGDIIDINGKVIGSHNGMWNYTIGQRKGLGISSPLPLYVIQLDAKNNRVIVGNECDTINTWIKASNIVWQAIQEIQEPIQAQAKIRSVGNPIPCTVSLDTHDNLYVKFNIPVKAATCGQSVVIYKDDIILCGGIICETSRGINVGL